MSNRKQAALESAPAAILTNKEAIRSESPQGSAARAMGDASITERLHAHASTLCRHECSLYTSVRGVMLATTPSAHGLLCPAATCTAPRRRDRLPLRIVQARALAPLQLYSFPARGDGLLCQDHVYLFRTLHLGMLKMIALLLRAEHL